MSSVRRWHWSYEVHFKSKGFGSEQEMDASDRKSPSTRLMLAHFLIIGTFGRAWDQRALYAIVRSMARLDCYQGMLVTLDDTWVTLSCDQRESRGSHPTSWLSCSIPTVKPLDSGNGVGPARQPKNRCTDFKFRFESDRTKLFPVPNCQENSSVTHR